MPLKIKYTRKQISDFVLAFVLCYIGIGAVLYFCQRDFIYLPDRGEVKLSHTGALPVVVQTDDGLSLRGWYAAPKDGNPVAVYFHGNAGNAGSRDFAAIPFIRQGYGFLFAEYRGYGGNPGSPSEQGFYNDARAYINWLTTTAKVGPEKIILYGESIGTGPAVKMAEERSDFSGLILVSPYTSLVAVAQKLYPVFPAGLIVRDRYDNLSRIGGLDEDMPILLIHGRRDRTIPFAHAQELKAANDRIELVPVDAAGHNDIYMHGTDKKIVEFIKKLN